MLLALIGAWTASYIGNRELIAAVHASAAIHYASSMRRWPSAGRRMPTSPPLLPPLDTLRDMPGGYDEREKETPLDADLRAVPGRASSAAPPTTRMSGR